MHKRAFTAAFALTFVFICSSLNAKSSMETPDTEPSQQSLSRKHRGAILALARVPGTDSFFSAGQDGFLTLHTGDTGESWQLSNIPIRAIAVNPDRNCVAVYESDGFSINRISVWDWKFKKRMYAKRFRDSITAISWSAKGSWLIIGNTSIEGIAILDKDGNPQKRILGTTGIVSLGTTGASESNMITFGPSGLIRYTDTGSGKERAVYQAERDTRNPVLYLNNLKIAGYRDGAILEIDATSGKTITTYPATEPIMATDAADDKPAWFERSDSDTWQLRLGNEKSIPFSLDDKSSIKSAISLDDRFIIGSGNGNLYTIPKDAIRGNTMVPVRFPDSSIPVIDDIASDGSRLFLLAAGSVYAAVNPDSMFETVFHGVTANRFTMVDSQFIFWSDSASGDVTLTAFDGTDRRIISKAKEGIRSLSVLGTRISFVEGTSTVHVIDTAAPSAHFTYSGAGLQDAVLVSPDRLIVSKSGTSRSPNPLLVINTTTGETVPLLFTGDLCYGLRLTSPLERDFSTLNGFIVRNGDVASTELSTFSVNHSTVVSSSVTAEVTYADEDLTAILVPDGRRVYTNLGKGPFLEISTQTGRQREFERGYALPSKMVLLDDYTVTLNNDGSIGWYDRNTCKRIAFRTLPVE